MSPPRRTTQHTPRQPKDPPPGSRHRLHRLTAWLDHTGLDRRLSKCELAVLRLLARYSPPGSPERTWRLSTLAQATGYNRSTVLKAILALGDLALLRYATRKYARHWRSRLFLHPHLHAKINGRALPGKEYGRWLAWLHGRLNAHPTRLDRYHAYVTYRGPRLAGWAVPQDRQTPAAIAARNAYRAKTRAWHCENHHPPLKPPPGGAPDDTAETSSVPKGNKWIRPAELLPLSADNPQRSASPLRSSAIEVPFGSSPVNPLDPGGSSALAPANQVTGDSPSGLSQLEGGTLSAQTPAPSVLHTDQPPDGERTWTLADLRAEADLLRRFWVEYLPAAAAGLARMLDTYHLNRRMMLGIIADPGRIAAALRCGYADAAWLRDWYLEEITDPPQVHEYAQPTTRE